MGVADNDAEGDGGRQNRHYARCRYSCPSSHVANSCRSCASIPLKVGKLGDSASWQPRKGTDDTELKSLQFFFAPAHRSRTDTPQLRR